MEGRTERRMAKMDRTQKQDRGSNGRKDNNIESIIIILEK